MERKWLNDAKNILQAAATEQGLELVSVRFGINPEIDPQRPILEALVDKDYAITLPMIEAYTQKVSPLLDAIPGLPDNFLLSIASPGSEREIPITDLPKLLNRDLEIVVAKSGETILGKLVTADKDSFVLLRFVKGRKTKTTFRSADVRSICMGYKA
jgi:ribosome maturation factor RimP